MPYLLVHHRVEDYARWKPVYDARVATRRSSGSRGAHLLRSADDPNELVILFEWDTLENARSFAESRETREAMKQGGLAGPLELGFLVEVERTPA